MISHMPSNSSILASEEEANLQYHTEDGFLEDYGSNFFQAFSNYYPLVPSDNGIPGKVQIDRFLRFNGQAYFALPKAQASDFCGLRYL